MAEQCKSHLYVSTPTTSNLPQPLHPKQLNWMCEQIVRHVEDWSTTKLHLWLGFVQSGALANQILDFEGIKAMFDKSKSAYGADGRDIDLADHLDPTISFRIDLGGRLTAIPMEHLYDES